MSDIKHIPLNRLSVSEHNVRRTDRKTDIEALSASIASVGLVQNLTVTAQADDTFEVVAGARRLAALKLLAKTGAIAKDCAIPCHVVSVDAATEISLTENVQRVAMNVMDEVEAFAALVESGQSSEDIARRFGCTLRHVEQRQALARLSPKIRAAYRKGEINLDVARAFCLTDDHAAQERVFKQMGKPITHAHGVRHALTQGRIPAHDKLAKFVGLEAYEAAGGRIVRDLFEDDIAFLDDGDLLQRLAGEKAEALREQLLSEGWGWADIQFGHSHIEGCAAERLRPSQRKHTAKEKKALIALESEIAALDEKLEEAEDDSPLWEDREQAETKLEALREAATTWDRALMAHAGAMISIDQAGGPIITRGLIKRANLKAIQKLSRKAASTSDTDEALSGAAPSGQDERDCAPSGPRLTKSLVERLTAARTRSLRSKLAQSPHVALALLVHTLMRRSVARTSVSGVGIESHPVGFEDDDRFERDRIALGDHFPDDPGAHLAACLDASPDTLLAALALLAAETLDVTHVGVSPDDRRVQEMSDTLATALKLDMTHHWEATQDFWEKVPKAIVLAALETAPSLTRVTAKKRASMLAGFAKMKKTELASTAAKLLAGTGWLPDLLITPPREPAFVVTPAGEAALAAAAA